MPTKLCPNTVQARTHNKEVIGTRRGVMNCIHFSQSYSLINSKSF